MFDRKKSKEPEPTYFVNYSGAADYLTGGYFSGEISFDYDEWRGFESETEKFKNLRRALLSASSLRSLELRARSPQCNSSGASVLSPMESELFADFLRESRSIKRFRCDYSFMSQAMTENLLLSETIETIYIDQKINSHRDQNQDVDEAFGRLGKMSQASFIWLQKIGFRHQSSIRGILRARNLTKLNLWKCVLDQPERNILLKLLATNYTLKAFFSDMVFDVKELIPYWNGETDPRPGLNWHFVEIRKCEMIWSMKGFARERVSRIRAFPSRRLDKMILTILERSKNPNNFHWTRRTPKDFCLSFTPEWFYKIFPHAKESWTFERVQNLLYPLLVKW